MLIIADNGLDNAFILKWRHLNLIRNNHAVYSINYLINLLFDYKVCISESNVKSIRMLHSLHSNISEYIIKNWLKILFSYASTIITFASCSSFVLFLYDWVYIGTDLVAQFSQGDLALCPADSSTFPVREAVARGRGGPRGDLWEGELILLVRL